MGVFTLILAETCIDMQSAWCVLGDFNSVLDLEDRLGRNIFTHEKEEFRDTLLDDCGLFDIYPSGYTFTWSNRHGFFWGEGVALKLIEFSSIKYGRCCGIMQELCCCHRESLILLLQLLAL